MGDANKNPLLHLRIGDLCSGTGDRPGVLMRCTRCDSMASGRARLRLISDLAGSGTKPLTSVARVRYACPSWVFFSCILIRISWAIFLMFCRLLRERVPADLLPRSNFSYGAKKRLESSFN